MGSAGHVGAETPQDRRGRHKGRTLCADFPRGSKRSTVSPCVDCSLFESKGKRLKRMIQFPKVLRTRPAESKNKRKKSDTTILHIQNHVMRRRFRIKIKNKDLIAALSGSGAVHPRVFTHPKTGKQKIAFVTDDGVGYEYVWPRTEHLESIVNEGVVGWQVERVVSLAPKNPDLAWVWRYGQADVTREKIESVKDNKSFQSDGLWTSAQSIPSRLWVPCALPTETLWPMHGWSGGSHTRCW